MDRHYIVIGTKKKDKQRTNKYQNLHFSQVLIIYSVYLQYENPN